MLTQQQRLGMLARTVNERPVCAPRVWRDARTVPACCEASLSTVSCARQPRGTPEQSVSAEGEACFALRRKTPLDKLPCSS